ncbi:MAG: hypothetical protein HeimC2_42230, partial [Candidatus Heimdallarchaeota archaeon LC_2]
AGIYNYTIFISDIEGNQANDTVAINVTEESVFTVVPADPFYIEGEIGNFLNWTVEDTNPDWYELYRQNVSIIDGSWVGLSGEVLSFNIDGLIIGVYNFTLFINDTDGNFVTSLVWVTVSDNPIWNMEPNDIVYSEGISGNHVNWNASDDFPDYYEIYNDTGFFTSGSWTSGVNITIALDGFEKGIYNYTLFIYDTVGNVNVTTFTVTVNDNTLPLISGPPSDYSYDEGDPLGNTIEWSYIEKYPDHYDIYDDFGLIKTGLWNSSGEAIIINVDGLSKGVYNYTVFVYDKTGNSDNDTVTITITDGTIPFLVDSPTNFQYAEGAPGNTLTWDATDAYAFNYEIWNSTHLLNTSSWTSGLPIIYDIDGFLKGLHNFTIIFFDESGNWIHHTVIFEVTDETDPIVTLPINDFAFNESGGLQILIWRGSDSYNDTYIIYKNEIQVDSGNWNPGVDISWNITSLLKGEYNYTIIIYDVSGNFDFDTVIITVNDNALPILVDSPSNTQYPEGDLGNTLTWDATDNYAATYEIWNETNQLTSGIWNSGIPIIFGIDSKEKGFYNFTIIFIDESLNWIHHTVIFEVTDETFPIFILPLPSNTQYAEGDGGNSLTWDASDKYASTYEIWNATNQLKSDIWTSGVPIVYPIDGFDKGTYNFTIIFIDESNNRINHTIIFTVTDETIPQIDHPTNINYLEGETNATITTINWIVSDKYADYYEIYNGSNLLINTTWSSGTISLDVSGSILSLYTYTIFIYDLSGNVVSDIVQVRVVERTAPIITFTPTPVQYNEETVVGKSLIWVASDTYNDTYIIYKNGTNFQTGSWNDGENITLSLDGLTKGWYNFTIEVRDSSLNSNESTVWVTIFDELPPNLSVPPSNISYESGETGNKITWLFTDNYPDTYEIYHNGTLVDSGILPSNRELDYAVDNDLVFGVGIDPLAVGFHDFTIIALDKSGNELIDTVIVEVKDTITPVFTTFSVVTYEYFESSTGKQLNWTIFDQNPNKYEILGNGTGVLITLIWSSSGETTITYNALKYEKGVWNYTIIIYDDSGHFSIHTTIVTVTDILSPIFISTPLENEFTIVEGTQVNNLQWSMDDNHEDTYVMYINDVAVFTNSWISNQIYQFDINGLSAGFYNYTLFINDTSSNIFISTILITVVDLDLPFFISLPTISNYTEGTTGHDLIWNVNEIHPHHFNISRDGLLLINESYINNEDKIWNIDNLEAGFYNFTVFFVDESGNELYYSFILEVIDETAPVLISEPVDHTINETTTDNFLEWVVTDIHAHTFVISTVGFTRSGDWVDSEPIRINIDGFEPGFYDFKMVISDESGNSIISFVTIRVKDPTITDTIRPIIEIETRVYEADTEEFQGSWLTTPKEDKGGVDGGTVKVQLFQNLNIIDTFEVITRSDGNFTITFDYTDLNPNNYTWIISFLKDGYQEWFDIEIQFEVLPHTYGITIIIEDSIQQGREYTIVAALKYLNNDSTNPTLSLSEYTPISQDFSVAPYDISVEFTIDLIYTDGTGKQIIKVTRTNQDGIALIVLSEQDTTDLDRILSINVQVLESDTNNLTNLEFNSDDLPGVQASSPTSFELAIKFIRENIILLPVILVSIVSLAIVGMQFNNRRVERIRQINNAVKSAHVELQAIKSIESIIIQTSSKLTIYEEQVARSNVNSTLIGGMVTAFSSFLDEVGKSELFGFEMMEREGLSLTLHQGKISNMIIISTDKLPIVLLSQIKDAQEDIENSFKNNFTKTTRGVTRLTTAEIHPKFHNADFKLDLIDDLSFKGKNIKKMLKQRSLSRALKFNIRMLYEFPDSDYFEGDTFQLGDIIDFFNSKGITERVSSRTIMLAYQFDVIESIQFKSPDVE